MSSLKIINSPHSRIMTQCEHCQHIMKTPADALYYLVECPSCFKDFVVKRYKEAALKTKKQVQQVRAKVQSSTNVSDEAFIKTIYNLSWPFYKLTIGTCLVGGTFVFGFTSNMYIPLAVILTIFTSTILHYLILCAGGVYFNRNH
ncbi:MAG: hypothetical protein NE327_12710 [Lentisphaeraceae bacterium]|nr:hypothetical protein [Lentisphaeraceae bacterium]